MTESEAKTKWCPMGRVVMSGGVVGNVDEKAKFAPTCIGSACAMWRWDIITPEERRQIEAGGAEAANDLCVPGYCGLAGKL